MKKIPTLALAICVIGCSQEVPFSEKKQEQNSSPANVAEQAVRVVNWGPQNTVVGINPNRQPDGTLGLWFQLNSTKGLTNVTIQFDGTPALSTVIVNNTLITTSVPEALIQSTGQKQISMSNESNNTELFNTEFLVVNN